MDHWTIGTLEKDASKYFWDCEW